MVVGLASAVTAAQAQMAVDILDENDISGAEYREASEAAWVDHGYESADEHRLDANLSFLPSGTYS